MAQDLGEEQLLAAGQQAWGRSFLSWNGHQDLAADTLCERAGKARRDVMLLLSPKPRQLAGHAEDSSPVLPTPVSDPAGALTLRPPGL